MSDTVVNKLKKYVLYISVLFFSSIGIHLTYVYLYNDAQSEAQEGGTISEAIIGNFPHFNPLLPSNDHNSYINGLLYRSMLEYSTDSKSFESDLFSCNLENLLYIECVLENNLTWSNGTAITPEDVKATLNIISQTKVNPIIASLLDETTIETSTDSISFSNNTKDINFLKIFLQPILPKPLIETLDTESIDGNFSEINGIYSGRFILTSISQDETVGITKITLGKNQNYFGNKLFINFLILNLFKNEAHFLKNKNSFNFFNDTNAIIGNTIPRLKVYEYTLSQFVGSFFNTQTLTNDFRTYIGSVLKRDEIVSTLGEIKVTPSYNPFLSKTLIDSTQRSDFNISSHLETLGYYSKKELLKSSLALRTTQKEKIISSEASISEPVDKIQEIKQKDLTYIISPTQEKYNFTSEDNVLIKGRVDSDVEAVYINDYQLSGYSPGDTLFYYRLLESYDSIVPGENSYKLYFEIDGEKKLIEEFIYIYETDTEKLQEITSNFFIKNTIQEDTIDTPIEEIKVEEKPILTSKIKTSLSASEIEVLDGRFYYDTQGTMFKIDMIYAQTDKEMDVTAQKIQSQLEQVGIYVKLTGLSLGDITVGVRNESLEYDILLIGIDLGYFTSNIYPYFHSSQVKNGYNFANYSRLSLDILLEELKSNNLSTTKREELEEKMLEIMKEANIVKVFYTPKTQLLVDKNIKDFTMGAYLPDPKHRYFPLIKSYLSERKMIQTGNKDFFGFLKYLFSQIHG